MGTQGSRQWGSLGWGGYTSQSLLMTQLASGVGAASKAPRPFPPLATTGPQKGSAGAHGPGTHVLMQRARLLAQTVFPRRHVPTVPTGSASSLQC